MAVTNWTSPRDVFGQRAAQYTTSTCHTDPEVLQKVVALCAPQPHWQVLDAGTGTGHTALSLAPGVRFVTGIDVTPEMLVEATKLRCQQGVQNIAFGLADVAQLPFPDRCFDLITCRRAAHHFPDLGRVLKEMSRVLRPSATLVVDDRSVPEEDTVDRLMNEFDRLHDPSHVRQYRPSEWRSMLANAGFEVRTTEMYTKHRPLSSLTQDLSEVQIRSMISSLRGLGSRQSKMFDLEEREGELHFNHWYLLVAATKR
jgi:ubiquinone/menaquinone biosynthesis C-methylase UbiE